MPTSPYVYERQAEYWTSKLIEDFLFKLGFQIIALPIPGHIENLLPADFIFFDKSHTKLFGLQYKALYQNERDHWNLDEHQHQTLELYPWIYYCLLEIKDIREFGLALHWARLAKANFSYQEKLYPDGLQRFSNYSRWASFFKELQSCRRGVSVASAEHLQGLLMAGTDDPSLERITREASDLFLIDFASMNVVHYSPFLSRTA
jgi:hypothetical protein